MRGAGKSVLAKMLFFSYPYDRVLIDPNGDIEVPDATAIEAPIPTRWPGRLFDDPEPDRRRHRQTLVFRPDFHDPNVYEDIDRVCGLAFSHRRTCLFVTEAHEALPAAQMQRRPHARRNLRQGRHQDLTQIYDTPRPQTVDPLAISNAEWVYIFKLPNPNDRKRVAENIGWDPKEFDEAVAALKKHEYLRYDHGGNDGEGDLAHFPPLPQELVNEIEHPPTGEREIE